MAHVLVLPSTPPLIHRISESDARIRIGESERAAGAEVSEGPRARTEPALGHGELEPEPEPCRSLQHDVVAVHVLRARERDDLRREHVRPPTRPLPASAE